MRRIIERYCATKELTWILRTATRGSGPSMGVRMPVWRNGRPAIADRLGKDTGLKRLESPPALSRPIGVAEPMMGRARKPPFVRQGCEPRGGRMQTATRGGQQTFRLTMNVDSN